MSQRNEWAIPVGMRPNVPRPAWPVGKQNPQPSARAQRREALRKAAADQRERLAIEAHKAHKQKGRGA